MFFHAFTTHTVYSENQTVRPHDNLCIPVDHDVNGCEVIWPDSEGGDCACGCGDILNCVCVNSTGYNVKSVQSQGSSEIQICWMNLTQDKNLTHIFAAIETRYTSEDNTTSNPTAIRTYSSAYIIIIAGMQLAIITRVCVTRRIDYRPNTCRVQVK